MVIFTHDTIRLCGRNCFLVHPANKEKHSSMYRIALAERASLEELDRLCKAKWCKIQERKLASHSTSSLSRSRQISIKLNEIKYAQRIFSQGQDNITQAQQNEVITFNKFPFKAKRCLSQAQE